MNKKDLLDKESQLDDLILVQFYADWCPHCRRVVPIIKEFEEEHEKRGVSLVVKINIDDNEDLANEYNVDTIPTFILMRSGKQLWFHSGELTIEKLVEAVEKNR